MEFSRNQEKDYTGEYGFTLPEVLITIAILGILMAIAVPTWQNVVSSRSVDSAANQLVSDLRLASSKSTNQLAEWQVEFTSDSAYQLQKVSGGPSISRTLPDDTKLLTGSEVGAGGSITFKPDGQAISPDPDGDGETKILVGFNGGTANTVSINPATSRAEIG